jgi:hypothetical protein
MVAFKLVLGVNEIEPLGAIKNTPGTPLITHDEAEGSFADHAKVVDCPGLIEEGKKPIKACGPLN